MSLSPIATPSVEDLNNTIIHCEDVLSKGKQKKMEKMERRAADQKELAEKFAKLDKRCRFVQQLKTQLEKDLDQAKKELAAVTLELEERKESERGLGKRNAEMESATREAVAALKTSQEKYVKLQERARGLEQVVQKQETTCHLLKGQITVMEEDHKNILAAKEAEKKLLFRRHNRNADLLKIVESIKEIDRVYLPKVHRDFYDAHGGVVPSSLRHAGAMVDTFTHAYYGRHRWEKELAQGRMEKLLQESDLPPGSDATYRSATMKIHALRNEHAHPTTSAPSTMDGLKAFTDMVTDLGEVLSKEEKTALVNLFKKMCTEEEQAEASRPSRRTASVRSSSSATSLPWSTATPWNTSTPVNSRPWF